MTTPTYAPADYSRAAIVDPITCGPRMKLRVPMVADYSSTFLPEGKRTVLRTWYDLTRYMGASVLNTSDAAKLESFFNYAVMVEQVDPQEGSVFGQTIVAHAPHGMTNTQNYTLVPLHPSPANIQDAMDSDEGANKHDLACFYAYWEFTRGMDINDATLSAVDDALVEYGDRDLRDYFNR